MIDVATSVRAMLAPVLETIRQSRSERAAEQAANLLDEAVRIYVQAPEHSIDPLARSAALGSNEAIAWLGLAFIDAADLAEATDADNLKLTGLGWLETAMLCGDQPAMTWFVAALRDLPDDLLLRWKQRPAHSQTVVN